MKQKFKLNRYVYAFISEKETVVYGWIASVDNNLNYTIQYGSKDFIVPQMYLSKTLKGMVKNILGKDYIYAVVLRDYLKNHFKRDGFGKGDKDGI